MMDNDEEPGTITIRLVDHENNKQYCQLESRFVPRVGDSISVLLSEEHPEATDAFDMLKEWIDTFKIQSVKWGGDASEQDIFFVDLAVEKLGDHQTDPDIVRLYRKN